MGQLRGCWPRPSARFGCGCSLAFACPPRPSSPNARLGCARFNYSCWCLHFGLRPLAFVSLRRASRGPPPRFGGRGGAPAPSPPSPLPRRSLLSLQAVAPLATLGLRSLRSLGRAVSRLRRVPVRSPLRLQRSRWSRFCLGSAAPFGRSRPPPPQSGRLCARSARASVSPRLHARFSAVAPSVPFRASLAWHGCHFPCSASLSSAGSSAPRVPLGARARRSPIRCVSSRPSVGLRLSLGRGSCLASLDIRDPRRDVRGGASLASSGWFRAHRWRPFLGFCYHHLFTSMSFGACAPNPQKGVASPASRGMPMLNER